jgi:hypothetical protein
MPNILACQQPTQKIPASSNLQQPVAPSSCTKQSHQAANAKNSSLPATNTKNSSQQQLAATPKTHNLQATKNNY